jgi:CheY-like chemotaxis protein
VSSEPSVLVVDDEPDIRMLVRVFLERAGFSVIGEAEDGPQALERFYDLDPPSTPSVVLLDNRMPGLTGLEVAEQMLAQHPSQVIVLFSAHLDSAVKERARAIGIAACASKMETQRIPDVIRSVLPQASA